jgi:site-specific DNA recombinase
MRVAIYVRVSTAGQVDEGYSLDGQLNSCNAYAASQGWDIVTTYVEEGESAKDLNRTEVKRMLEDAATGVFDVLLFYRLDRLTRSVRDLHKILDTFERLGIKFRSATEMYDTTSAMGRLFITMVAAMAEWERGNLAERVRFGKEQLVREGNWPGGPVPFGYEWDGEQMHIVPDEYTTLRELRRLYMAGIGLRNISMELNNRNLLRREGLMWNPVTVGYTLENPIYAGKIRFGSKKKNGKYEHRKKGKHAEVIYADSGIPTIFTWEEYEEHIAIINRKEKYGNPKSNNYWFTGVLRCGRCGAKLKGSTYTNTRKDGHRYEPTRLYKCYSREQGKGCNMPMLRQVVAEEMIMSYVESITVGQEYSAAAHEQLGLREQSYTTEIESIQRDLRAISDRRRKWQYMFTEDMISESDFRKRKREDDEQERLLKEQMEHYKSLSVGSNPQAINYLVDMKRNWDTSNDAERRDWMQTIFECIVFDCADETGVGAHRFKTLRFEISDVRYN